MKTSFYDLSYEQRFAAYAAAEALNCDTSRGGGGSSFLSVSVAKGQFGALLEAMRQLGLEYQDSYYFPLGTDKPPAHLRHARGGFPDCCWLIANFLPLQEVTV
jgi:hypothetical protein